MHSESGAAEGQIDGDAVKPCGQGRLGAERPQLRVRPQQGVLHHVLGLVRVAHDAEHGRVHARLVPLGEGEEGVRVAG